ncbi:Alpha amylase, catalytic domain [Bryocella elongata]|uniref:Alpha amylase, catalytic domain n=1 Tax=Bryocella elongata TaxID=863522 RepID=A0A1H5YH84_9BACT|nr:alpha-amylase family glycosyl hydrolase [Bryocella elongata]SEG23050.1 Alpha amylase, catalytic domain [Bryocella elongata]
MEFHIARSIRDQLQLDDLLFSYTGNIVFANVAASRKLAQQLNEVRNPANDPDKMVHAGALFAMGLIDELNHALVAKYRKEVDPAVLSEAMTFFAKTLGTTLGSAEAGQKELDRLLLIFTEQFPNVAVYRKHLTATEWLKGTTEGMPNREAAFEELLMLWLANANPAFKPFRELFNDEQLKEATKYKEVTAALPEYFVTRPKLEEATLLETLCAPFLQSPDSLTGQLDFIRERWSKVLGADLKRVLLAIDTLREEDLAIWSLFHPPAPDWYRHGPPGRGDEGFVGDEYVGFDDEMWTTDAQGNRVRRYAADYQAPLNEYEAFSADQAWMPNVVLLAKSTYVWLEQLSKKYGRHIHRLDQIPEEEVRLMADRGITGLWLIGLWERSIASRTIKRLRGHHDAVASAYSLKEYRIAEDLGGNHAYEHLRDQAARFGVRLASDMVPNHMGIDSPWVIDNPDAFVYRWESPFPSYSFKGPDLSTDSRVEIKIEDHYYDQTDAAVVFRVRHHNNGATRYMYHGNDGTTFAWNDTAQLDYSKAAVREHVIQTILYVARLFPIIRFDAAMVLAKRHVQRLWFPLPGAGGSIPSRAENAMSQEEFDALMPHEFWREVVDRVAAEVPGTLLLAEAFWLLEGYFVRTLGMHRVYNSAFMNMLRDEENAKYRSYLKKTIEFDPDILKRYVNFMSNPDERTAIDQFGTGDKYFGVLTMMATLPGLPMFGHGQIEGYTERYGMEYKTAKMDERPNEGLIARHMHEVAPLLKQRKVFAESDHFVLYDFWTGYGTVNENVFAYSNRRDGQRGLILYNNSYTGTDGNIHISVAAMDKGSGEMRQRSLADGLGVPYDAELILGYRDTASGMEYLRRASEIHEHGLGFALRGFQYIVLLDWRELRSSIEAPWGRLCDQLAGSGVSSLDEALFSLRLQPMHLALRDALEADAILGLEQAALEASARATPSSEATPDAPSAADAASPVSDVTDAVDKTETDAKAIQPAMIENDPAPTAVPEVAGEASATAALHEHTCAADLGIDARVQAFAAAAQPFFERWVDSLPAYHRETVRGMRPSAASAFHDACSMGVASVAALPSLAHSLSSDWPAVVSRMLPIGAKSIASERALAPALAFAVLRSLPWPAHPVELFDRLKLRAALAEAFAVLGFEGNDAWRAAARVRVLLQHAGERDLLAPKLWSDPDVSWLTGVNESGGATWFNKESFEEMLVWLQLPSLLELVSGKATKVTLAGVEAAVSAACKDAAEAGYNLDRLLMSADATTAEATVIPAVTAAS